MRKAARQATSEIDLIALKVLMNRLLDHVIETRGIRTIELGEDYYWEVPAPARYRMDTDPGELDVGSLADDWEFLSNLLRVKEQPLASQLAELAPLLEYIGHKLAPELASQGG